MTANKPSTRKAKGRTFQQTVVKLLLNAFSSLTENDIRSTPMGTQGSDVWLSEEALKQFNYDVECKNVESLNIWNALKQCEERTEKSKRTPLVVFKRNRSDVYCCLKFDDFLKILTDGK